MNRKDTLADLKNGEWGRVDTAAGERAMRRRLLDLGFVPGTAVKCVGHSPAGDPAAYLVRGTVVALRRRDAQAITLERGERGALAWD